MNTEMTIIGKQNIDISLTSYDLEGNVGIESLSILIHADQKDIHKLAAIQLTSF